MAFEAGGVVFFQFPFRHATVWAYTRKLLISQPSGGPAVLGIVYQKIFIAMGGHSGLISPLFNRANAMQNPFAGRP